jgi:hypothetical protein
MPSKELNRTKVTKGTKAHKMETEAHEMQHKLIKWNTSSYNGTQARKMETEAHKMQHKLIK